MTGVGNELALGKLPGPAAVRKDGLLLDKTDVPWQRILQHVHQDRKH